jgi:hypothetical protein
MLGQPKVLFWVGLPVALAGSVQALLDRRRLSAIDADAGDGLDEQLPDSVTTLDLPGVTRGTSP